MIVTATRIIETCLDGTRNVEKTLDRTVDRKFIYHLAELGNLEYFSGFARPFFRITRPGDFIIKGIEGSNSFEVFVINPSSDPDRQIAAQVSRFRSGNGS